MRLIIILAMVLGALIFVYPGWDNLFINPMVNLLGWLYFASGSFGVAILVLTILTRVLLVPLAILQHGQTSRMQSLQPHMKALQKKYAGQKDRESRQRYQQEIGALYRQAGVNPIGCIGPIIVQFPIWIALYQTILRVIPTTPDGLVELGEALYSWNPANVVVPFNPYLFGIDLASVVSNAPSPIHYVVPVLVGGSLWLQQRVAATPSIDPQQQSSQRLMQWMLPIMFGYFTWFFPAGLAFYILVSNVFGVILQFFISRKSPLSLIMGGGSPPESGVKNDYTYKTEVAETPKTGVYDEAKRIQNPRSKPKKHRKTTPKRGS